MDIKTIVNEGQLYRETYEVQTEDTADALGNVGVEVLSTPRMISLMEGTATKIIHPHLSEGYRPVGTKINVEHLSPAFVGTVVTIEAILQKIDHHQLTYVVKVYDQNQIIGEGIYVQQVIDLNQFLEH